MDYTNSLYRTLCTQIILKRLDLGNDLIGDLTSIYSKMEPHRIAVQINDLMVETSIRTFDNIENCIREGVKK
jgi:hypothetical protein